MKTTLVDDKLDMPSWTNHPVLIYGARKSGTTLLLSLLDGTEGMVVFPEEVKLKLLRDVLFPEMPRAVDAYFSLSRTPGESSEQFDSEGYAAYRQSISSASVKNLAELLRMDIHGIYSNMRNAPPSPSCWGMKEVGGNTVDVLRFFRQLFFDGKVVSIVRDPLMVTRSVILERRRRGITLSFKALLKQTLDPIRCLHAQMACRPEDGVLTIRYEDLTGGQLEAVMRRTADFLGLPFSGQFLTPSRFGVPTVVKTSSRQTKEVFSSTNPWHDSLTFRERCVVSMLVFAIRANYFRRHGRSMPSYQRLWE